MFSQMRGGASMASGPSSRRSRCTVSGLSGQFVVSLATSAMPQGEGGVADPGHRQVRQPVVALLDVVHLDERLGGGDHVAMTEHRALGTAGRARGVGDHRRVVGAALGELGVVEAGVGRTELPPLLQHAVIGAQDGIVVERQAARIVVDDPAQLRQLVLERQRLVDLLLVLGDDDRRLGDGSARRPARRRSDPGRPAPRCRPGPGLKAGRCRAGAGCRRPTESLSPRLNPIAASPSARSRIWSR